MRVLLLGGTAEASALARSLAATPGVAVTTSLAGRTRSPVLPPGVVRVGGFGGVDGLAAWIRAGEVDVVVDATHPFAAVMPWHAFDACAALGIPRLRVRRRGFGSIAGAHRVGSLAAAARVVDGSSWSSVFLTTGRTGLAAFADVPGRRWLVRCVDPPVGSVPVPVEVVLDRGPFTPGGERRLMEAHGVDVVVTKDSGGPAAKLEVAASLGVEVVVVERPASPPGPVVETADAALSWLAVSPP